MASGIYHAEVSRIRDLTHDVRELDLTLTLTDPQNITYRPGQFVSFEVPKEGFSHPVTRPYSIASPPSVADRVTLLFNLVAGGPGSTYLHGLRLGDRVSFKGPAGSFYLREDLGRHTLFVGTGTGIAPLRSMILTLLEKNDGRSVTLYWGLRHERDLYYQEELQEMAVRHPRFACVTTLSQPGPDWTGHRGRVTALIQERVTSLRNLAVYLCGNGGMLKEVTALVQAKGLCPIYREKYY